jgi:hypothetical protein
MTQQTLLGEGAFDQSLRNKVNSNFTELYAATFTGIAPVAVTSSTVTLAAGTHSNRITTLDRAAGIAVTLPAATGTGNVYDLVVITTITSNTTTITRAGSDTMQGQAWVMSDGAAAVLAYDAAGTATVLTMNGTTQGGYVGHRIRLVDIATGKWHVTSMGKATGTEATPFS